MCVGDFGKRGDEGGVNDVPVGCIEEDTEGKYGYEREHFGSFSFWIQFKLIPFKSDKHEYSSREERGEEYISKYISILFCSVLLYFTISLSISYSKLEYPTTHTTILLVLLEDN